ncbi:MAG: hypothetical protein JWM56_506 [Candidatus Peribacteria bacterium]|nr:hypothetical protein [Candidatus Peribacteria bacterium]
MTANRKVKGLLEEVFGLGWKGEFNQLHNVLSDDSWQTLMSVFAAHEGEKFGKGREQLTITDAYICEVLESIRILGSVMRRGKEEESEE